MSSEKKKTNKLAREPTFTKKKKKKLRQHAGGG
jgi:hypothetical protein